MNHLLKRCEFFDLCTYRKIIIHGKLNNFLIFLFKRNELIIINRVKRCEISYLPLRIPYLSYTGKMNHLLKRCDFFDLRIYRKLIKLNNFLSSIR